MAKVPPKWLYLLDLWIVFEMSQFVEFSTMHLFQMSAISSPGIESMVTCVWAVDWQDVLFTMIHSTDKNPFSLCYISHAHILFRQTPHHNTTQRNTMIRIFTILAVCLVVLLLSVQVSKQNIRLMLRKTRWNFLSVQFSKISESSVFWRYTNFGLLFCW